MDWPVVILTFIINFIFAIYLGFKLNDQLQAHLKTVDTPPIGTWLVLLAIPISMFGFATWYFNKRLNQAAFQQMDQWAKARNVITHLLFGHTHWHQNRVIQYPTLKAKKEFSKILNIELSQSLLQLKVARLGGIVSSLKLPLLLLAGVLLLILHGKTEGIAWLTMAFAQLQLLIGRFEGPVSKVESLISEKAQSKTFSERSNALEHSSPIADSGESEFWGEAPVVELQSLDYSYPGQEHPVIHSCSANFSASKLHIILGESGSGKTTLFNILQHIISPQEGIVSVDQLSLENHQHKALATNVGVLDQFPYFLEGSLWENITLLIRCSDSSLSDEHGHLNTTAYPLVKTISDLENEAMKLLIQVGLGEILSHKILSTSFSQLPPSAADILKITSSPTPEQAPVDFLNLSLSDPATIEPYIDQLLRISLQLDISPDATEFSGGMRKKLALARVLLKKPRLLLLDEPSSGLDSISHRQVFKLLLSLRKEMTILMISHTLEDLDKADEIHVLNHGEFVQHGTFSELSETQGIFTDLVKGTTSLFSNPSTSIEQIPLTHSFPFLAKLAHESIATLDHLSPALNLTPNQPTPISSKGLLLVTHGEVTVSPSMLSLKTGDSYPVNAGQEITSCTPDTTTRLLNIEELVNHSKTSTDLLTESLYLLLKAQQRS